MYVQTFIEGRKPPQTSEDDWAKDEYRKLMGVCNKYEVSIQSYCYVYVTGPAIIDHVSANYTKLYFC